MWIINYLDGSFVMEIWEVDDPWARPIFIDPVLKELIDESKPYSFHRIYLKSKVI